MTDVTLTYNAGNGDCYGSLTAGFFNSSAVTVYVSTDSDGINENLRSWFPFASIALPRQITVVSATFKMTANSTSGANSTDVIMSCEAADNPGTPANQADLLGRTKSTATLATTLGQFTNGVTYSFDVTACVQEILNRSGWVLGNTIAIMVDENDATPRKRQVSSANSGSNMAQLVIVVRPYLPKAMFVG